MRQQVGEVVILQGVGTGEVHGKRRDRFGQHADFGIRSRVVALPSLHSLAALGYGC